MKARFAMTPPACSRAGISDLWASPALHRSPASGSDPASISCKRSRSTTSTVPSRRGPDDLHRQHLDLRQPGALERYLRQQAALRLRPLELIEDQIAERIENDSAAVCFPRLGDVRMMSRHHARARLDGGAGKLHLPRVRFL